MGAKGVTLLLAPLCDMTVATCIVKSMHTLVRRCVDLSCGDECGER